MSGGSMDYLYQKVKDVRFKINSPLRRAFYVHLQKVAKALKAIEWNDSGDGDSSENVAIHECVSGSDVIWAVIEEAERVKEELNEAIKIAQNLPPGSKFT